MNYRDDFINSLPAEYHDRAANAWDKGFDALTDDPTVIVEAFSESGDYQLRQVGFRLKMIMEGDIPVDELEGPFGAFVFKMMAPYIAQAAEDYARNNM